jgi:fatty-acid desaturase
MSNKLDEIRTNTLTKIERNERNYKYAFVVVAFVELLFLVAFLLLADFSDRVHVLLLLTAIAIYTIVGFGLIALGLHVNRNTLRVLQAIEISGKEKD